MADNKTLPDASGVSFTVRTKDNAGVNLPAHVVADSAGVNLGAVDVNGRLQVSQEGSRATYNYAIQAQAPVATPTDFIIIQGSGTKTVRIKYITINGQATAQGSMPVNVIRRSTAGTIGGATLNAISPAKHDSGDAAATATVSFVSAANVTSVGAAAGLVGARRLGFSALGTGSAGLAQAQEWDFSWRNDKPIILRGTSEFLCINLAGAAVPSGGVVDFEMETEEDAS